MIPGPVVVLILLAVLVLAAGIVHYWPAARRATFTSETPIPPGYTILEPPTWWDDITGDEAIR